MALYTDKNPTQKHGSAKMCFFVVSLLHSKLGFVCAISVCCCFFVPFVPFRPWWIVCIYFAVRISVPERIVTILREARAPYSNPNLHYSYHYYTQLVGCLLLRLASLRGLSSTAVFLLDHKLSS